MAFPIPSHLPRRANPQDISSKILSKIDKATNRSLTASLAKSWLAELDETIQSTKERIHERIHADLPKFEQQLASSKSVQTRLQSLTNSVDVLSETLSNPKTGLITTLVTALTAHATLAQESTDAKVNHEALSHLIQYRSAFASLSSLVEAGKLPEAVRDCERLERLLEGMPVPLKQIDVMVDLKRKFRVVKGRTEEQLSDAYSRSIFVSPTKLTIRSSVQVRQTETILPLPSILSSLPPIFLSNHLTTLRRDLVTYHIDKILKQPISITISSPNDHEPYLSHFPSPPDTETRISRLENLITTLTFLAAHLFPSLPPSQAASFPRSLCNPITTSLLNNLLIPSLPSSFELIPSFLQLVGRAVEFEQRYIVDMLGGEISDCPVKSWADGVSGHYERQRRLEILESSRIIIIAPENVSDSFLVEIHMSPEPGHTGVVPIQVDEEEKGDDPLAWGFEDEEKMGEDSSAETRENGWAFDDDVEPELAAEVTPEPEPAPTHADADADPTDAWGWNDNDNPSIPDGTTEETAWEDPWSEDSSISGLGSDSRPPPAPSIESPKVATRLEKFSSKGKKAKVNGESPLTPPVTSPIKVSPISPSIHHHGAPSPAPAISVEKRPRKLTAVNVPSETYLVSGRMKHIINMVDDVLSEGKELAASKIFSSSTESSAAPGTTLFQSASSILDLFRALYPVKFNTGLGSSPERALRFSNDCLYLSGEIEQIEHRNGLAMVKEKLLECKDRLKVLGDSWFEDTIEKQRQSVDDIIMAGAEGFTDTAEQDRYDECESGVSQVLQEIRRLAQGWKGILAKSKYYIAIGLVTDAALSRVLGDVLALPDIPEVESHRLSELCRILNALEGLFVEDPNQPSFVVAYVPSWLKFSYLSELLEASMADISYLFEEGALVDFDVEELARLVRALFADTPLRATTINKLLGGHPILTQ